jgi:hypothetical protein
MRIPPTIGLEWAIEALPDAALKRPHVVDTDGALEPIVLTSR